LTLFFMVSFLSATESPDFGENLKKSKSSEFYKYWNPYRRILDLRGEPQTFYGQDYYEVTYNIDNRIKTVTHFGADREAKETFHFLWSRSGVRSEYKVEFLTDGNASRLDEYLYANELSYTRPGWIADIKSRKDGRPSEASFSDKLGFTYFYYHFNYSIHEENNNMTEVIESSYYDSKGEFVGRHLLFWEGGDILRMIQYFDMENKIIRSIEFIQNWKVRETTRIISGELGQELERKIIPIMKPDKYAYKLEWDGREIINHEVFDDDTLNLLPKSFLSFSYWNPIAPEKTLVNHSANVGYTIGLGRRDVFTVRNMTVNVGLEMNYIDFKSKIDSVNFQTLSYFLVSHINPKISWTWIPRNLETRIKIGAGLVSPGFGFNTGLSAVFNLLPTPLSIGLNTQFNWVSGTIDGNTQTYWSSVGLVFGLNFDDKILSLF